MGILLSINPLSFLLFLARALAWRHGKLMVLKVLEDYSYWENDVLVVSCCGV